MVLSASSFLCRVLSTLPIFRTAVSLLWFGMRCPAKCDDVDHPWFVPPPGEGKRWMVGLDPTLEPVRPQSGTRVGNGVKGKYPGRNRTSRTKRTKPKDGDRTSSNDGGRPRPWAKAMREVKRVPLANVPTRTRSSPNRGGPPTIRWDRAKLTRQAGLGAAGTSNTPHRTGTSPRAPIGYQKHE